MSRISNDLRKIFLSQYKLGKKPKEIAAILSVTPQTINSWIRLIKSGTEDLLFNLYKHTHHVQKYSEKELREVFTNNPFSFNKTLGQELGLSATRIQIYRKGYGYTYKKSTKSYRESNPELKKNSKNS